MLKRRKQEPERGAPKLKLLELINKRAEVVQEIGQLKGKQGVTRFDPVRERKMLDHIADHNEGPFETSTLQLINRWNRRGFRSTFIGSKIR